MKTHSDLRLVNVQILKAAAPVLGVSALEAEILLANAAEQRDNEHALVFWMRSE